MTQTEYNVVVEQVTPIVESDGTTIDPETGEILSIEKPESEESLALWALRIRSAATAKRAGIQVEFDMLRAQLEQHYQAQLTKQDRKVEYIDRVYGPTIQEYTIDQLAQQRGKKSVSTPYGTVGFRTTKGRTEVTDLQAALNSMTSKLWSTDSFSEMEAICKAITIKLNISDLDPENGKNAVWQDATKLFMTLQRRQQSDGRVSILTSKLSPELVEMIEGIETQGDTEKFYIKHATPGGK